MLLARRARALRRHLPVALGGNDRGIHQARVASRRLRELLPILGHGPGRARVGRVRRKIRRLTRALGAVRDLDVALAVLDELAARDTLPRLALEEVRGHVAAERHRRRAVMSERLDRVNAAKLGRRLASLRDALEEEEGDRWRELLAARVARRAGRLESALHAAGHVYAAGPLHRVRIAAKKLRYALEIAGEAGVRPAAPLVRALKRTQDVLGRLHDLQVLLEHVAAVQAEPAHRSIPEGGLDTLARALENEARHLHARFLSQSAALGEVIEATRRTIVPHLAHAGRTGSARTLRMTLAHGGRGTRRAAPRAAGQRA